MTFTPVEVIDSAITHETGEPDGSEFFFHIPISGNPKRLKFGFFVDTSEAGNYVSSLLNFDAEQIITLNDSYQYYLPKKTSGSFGTHSSIEFWFKGFSGAGQTGSIESVFGSLSEESDTGPTYGFYAFEETSINDDGFDTTIVRSSLDGTFHENGFQLFFDAPYVPFGQSYDLSFVVPVLPSVDLASTLVTITPGGIHNYFQGEGVLWDQDDTFAIFTSTIAHSDFLNGPHPDQLVTVTASGNIFDTSRGGGFPPIDVMYDLHDDSGGGGGPTSGITGIAGALGPRSLPTPRLT